VRYNHLMYKKKDDCPNKKKDCPKKKIVQKKQKNIYV